MIIYYFFSHCLYLVVEDILTNCLFVDPLYSMPKPLQYVFSQIPFTHCSHCVIYLASSRVLNLNILCFHSSIRLFPKIYIELPNDTSTCCGCSRTSWCESLVTHTLNFLNFQSSRLFMVFRFCLDPNSGSFTRPIKSI